MVAQVIVRGSPILQDAPFAEQADGYVAMPGTGIKLVPGMVLAVEPMLTAGTIDTVVLDDGWSVLTADGKLAAHVEHTIAITDDGPEIFTLP